MSTDLNKVAFESLFNAGSNPIILTLNGLSIGSGCFLYNLLINRKDGSEVVNIDLGRNYFSIENSRTGSSDTVNLRDVPIDILYLGRGRIHRSEEGQEGGANGCISSHVGIVEIDTRFHTTRFRIPFFGFFKYLNKAVLGRNSTFRIYSTFNAFIPSYRAEGVVPFLLISICSSFHFGNLPLNKCLGYSCLLLFSKSRLILCVSRVDQNIQLGCAYVNIILELFNVTLQGEDLVILVLNLLDENLGSNFFSGFKSGQGCLCGNKVALSSVESSNLTLVTGPESGNLFLLGTFQSFDSFKQVLLLLNEFDLGLDFIDFGVGLSFFQLVDGFLLIGGVPGNVGLVLGNQGFEFGLLGLQLYPFSFQFNLGNLYLHSGEFSLDLQLGSFSFDNGLLGL